MTNDLSFLVNIYSSYLSGQIAAEQMFATAANQVVHVWKSDANILLLDLQFDQEVFPNPQTELNYRLLNLELARHVKSDTAVANTAFSASKVAVSKLQDFPSGLSLMLESTSAYIRFGNLNAAMMGFRNTARFYLIKITELNAAYLNKDFHQFLSLICEMSERAPASSELADALQITLDCLENLFSFKYDPALAMKAVDMLEKQVLPKLRREDKTKFLMRLGDITE